MNNCEGENCSVRKQICKETQKAIDVGKEPSGWCPQCPSYVGKCGENKWKMIKIS